MNRAGEKGRKRNNLAKNALHAGRVRALLLQAVEIVEGRGLKVENDAQI